MVATTALHIYIVITRDGGQ